MKRVSSKILKRAFLLAFLLVCGSGCAYYNTFYNVKKDFRAAERQTKRSAQGPVQEPQGGQPNRPGQPSQGNVPVQQYQQVIQSCGKLLEFYPKSRWVDDALMVMGVSYYRLQEFSRAERKFTELVTIFPKSKHVESATIWRAKSLVAQNMLEDAERILRREENTLTSPDARAGASRTLAEIYDSRGNPEEAVKYLEQISKISYSRDDKATDNLRLGRSYFAIGERESARNALLRCLELTRSTEEAFQSRKLLALIASEEGNYPQAVSYLLPLRTDRRFLDRSGEVEVELARVEARCGDPAIALRMLENYGVTSSPGNSKAQAYYLQGEVARDKLGDFQLAKAKFDSVTTAGGSRELQDSARQAARKLESGLTALNQIPILTDSLEYYKDNEPALEIEPDQEVSGEDTVRIEREQAISVDSDSFGVDSSASELQDSDSAFVSSLDSTREVALTPAELIADSIMRALFQRDSLRKREEAARDSLQPAVDEGVRIGEGEVQVTPQSGPNNVDLYWMRRRSVSRRLVTAHLEAASFFETVARNADSSYQHLEAAAAVPDSSIEHWRAVLQYAFVLQKSQMDSSRLRGESLLRKVSESEEVPIDLRNIARAKLNLPDYPVEESEQAKALRNAEAMLLGGADAVEVIAAYRQTLSFDSASLEGSRALHAIAYLQEYKLGDFESAKKTHQAIVDVFPDSSFAEMSRKRLAEPDSNSIFLVPEEELQVSFQPAFDLLTSESDSTGWPPDIGTLRGRRFK